MEIEEYKSRKIKVSDENSDKGPKRLSRLQSIRKERRRNRKGKEKPVWLTSNAMLINILVIVFILGLVIATAVTVITINRFTIRSYIEVEYTGINGLAKPTIIVDSAALKEEISKDKDRDNTDIDNFIYSLRLTTDAYDLSNGDSYIINVSFNEDYAKKLKINIKDREIKMKVKGLGKGELINLFDGVEVIFTGFSPEASVVIKNNYDDAFLRSLKFTADKSDHISTDDVITVSCDISVDDLGRGGYTTKSSTATYIANKLGRYVENASNIDNSVISALDEKVRNSINEEVEDVSFRMLYKASNDTEYLRLANDEKVTELDSMGKFFLLRNGSDTNLMKNYIYMIYEADVTVDERTEHLYFIYEFTGCYTDSSGQFNVNDTDLNKKYYVSMDYEALYNQFIEHKLADYTLSAIE